MGCSLLVCLGFLVGVVFIPGLAAAQATSPGHPPLVEEFFFTESAHAQEKRDVQLTWSFHHRRQEGHSLSDALLLLEYGVTEWLEVEAELPWSRRRESGHDAVAGVGNVGLGVMVALRRQPGFFVSVGLEVGLPTASSALGLADSEVEVEPFLVAGHRFGESELQAALFVGVEDKSEVGWDLAYVHAAGRWRGVLEVNGRSRLGTDTWLLTPGAYWKPSRSYEVGLAVPVGLHDAPGLGVMVKMTVEF